MAREQTKDRVVVGPRPWYVGALVLAATLQAVAVVLRALAGRLDLLYSGVGVLLIVLAVTLSRQRVSLDRKGFDYRGLRERRYAWSDVSLIRLAPGGWARPICDIEVKGRRVPVRIPGRGWHVISGGDDGESLVAAVGRVVDKAPVKVQRAR